MIFQGIIINDPIQISQCEGFWNCISPDAIIQSIGTLMGALIGAGIGSLGSYLFLRKRLIEKEKKFISDFYKRYRNCDKWLHLVIDRFEIFYKDWDERERNELSKQIDDNLLKFTLKSLDNITETEVPDKIYKDFDKIRDELGSIQAIFSMYHIIGEYPNYVNEDNKQNLRNHLDTLKEESENINSKLK